MFLFNDESPVTFNDPLPESVDVVIIGGGIIGISTAWYLLERGLTVLVCEKGRVAGEQSSRNWGWVRVTGRDPDEVPIAIESIKCWESMANELGDDLGFMRRGILTLADCEKEMAEYEEWLEVARTHDVDTLLFSKREIAKHIDVPSAKWCGGMITPSDGRAEPLTAVPTIARGVQARGGLTREACAVRTIDNQAGRIAGVVTEAGYVRTQAVVCAGGVWSTMFLANQGINFPQLAVRATVARTAEAPDIFGGAAGLKDVFIRRRLDGGYTVASLRTEHTIGANSFRFMPKFIGLMGDESDLRLRIGIDQTQPSFFGTSWSGDDESPFEKHRVLDIAPSADAIRLMRRNLQRRAPQLADVPFAESWGGVIDATPDIVPVMDQVDSHPGLFLASGFSGHGFGIGPGAGRVMADLVTGDRPKYDLSRFRFSRFSDGSKIRPGPSI
jgi:glycine/D-amino acid oxidase-like deaminating enzyme